MSLAELETLKKILYFISIEEKKKKRLYPHCELQLVIHYTRNNVYERVLRRQEVRISLKLIKLDKKFYIRDWSEKAA